MSLCLCSVVSAGGQQADRRLQLAGLLPLVAGLRELRHDGIVVLLGPTADHLLIVVAKHGVPHEGVSHVPRTPMTACRDSRLQSFAGYRCRRSERSGQADGEDLGSLWPARLLALLDPVHDTGGTRQGDRNAVSDMFTRLEMQRIACRFNVPS
jgi:hypothetical protein